jgi:NAD(P)H-dependent FMN reductase
MLAIVWHSRTGASEALAAAAAAGARAAAAEGCLLIRAEDAAPAVLLDASGYLFVCPENLGTMSGAMKEMFDQAYYPLLGQVEGRPYATIIAAGSDGRGAQAQIDRIVTGWRLRRIADPMIVNVGAQTPEEILTSKQVAPIALEAAKQLGQALSAGISMGVF